MNQMTMKKRLYVLFPIDVNLERESLYERLKHCIEFCERILEEPDLDYDVKLKAAAVLAQLASRASKIITDVQLKEIEVRLEGLEKEACVER